MRGSLHIPRERTEYNSTSQKNALSDFTPCLEEFLLSSFTFCSIQLLQQGFLTCRRGKITNNKAHPRSKIDSHLRAFMATIIESNYYFVVVIKLKSIKHTDVTRLVFISLSHLKTQSEVDCLSIFFPNHYYIFFFLAQLEDSLAEQEEI